MSKKINVVGMGYIGLPTALILHSKGYEVVGTDINKKLVDDLKNNRKKFAEEGIDELYAEAVNSGIKFEEDCVPADVYIIAVPTPYNKEHKKIDPQYVVSAVANVIQVCPQNGIIAIESTISPGTIDTYIRPLVQNKEKIEIAHVPERIIPGRIMEELRFNSRTIGADNEQTALALKEVYSSFCEGNIILTNIKTAEMTKVVENTYRDINIAFANELMKICRKADLDVYEVINIANRHPRVNILAPGPGVGGHCISVDPWFLVGEYPGLANIILAARRINDSMPEFVLKRLYEIMKKKEMFDISRVGFYGLTYKENVDDVRESPTLQLIDCMKEHIAFGANFYDPFVNEKIVDGQLFDYDEFIKRSDIIVVMVGHDQIIQFKQELKNKVVLDTRNVIKMDTAEVYHL